MMMRLFGVVVLLVLLFGWAPAALAYFPPCRDVTSSCQHENSNYYIAYSVFDPLLQKDMPGRSINFFGLIYDQRVLDGIVIAQSPCNSDFSGWVMYVSVYDPGRQRWMEKVIDIAYNGDYVDFTTDLLCSNGVVAFKTKHQQKVWSLTYDPQVGEWRELTYSGLHGKVFIFLTGEVFYFENLIDNIFNISSNIRFAIYDPLDSNWHIGEVDDIDTWDVDKNTNTLVITKDGAPTPWGYARYLGGWSPGIITDPQALFLVQPSTGSAPLTVCITDLSIGANSFTTSLAAGNFEASSSDRSFFYTFNNPGNYTLSRKAFVKDGSEYDSKVQWVYVQEITPPTGGILINAGAQYTNTTAVTLDISTSSTDPGIMMRFASDDSGPWSEWYSFQATTPYYLPAGDGPRDVFAQFKDSAGILSNVVSAGITLDPTPPTGSITINGGAQYTNTTAVTLYLSASDVGGSGVTSMSFGNMVQDPVTQQWTAPNSTPWEPYATSKSWNLSAGDGEKRVAVSFLDAAGNGIWASASIILDSTKPAGFSISINAGAPYTNNINGTVYTDAGGQSTTKLKVSLGKWNGTGITWGSWQPFQHIYPIDLSSYVSPLGVRGPNRTVYAQFLDMTTENIPATVTATIDLDTAPPVDGVLTATGGKNQVTLNWSGFSDANSGIKYFKLYCSTKGFPDVTKDPLIFLTGGTSYTHQNLQKATRYYYRVVAMDYAGNVSSGATAQARTISTTLPFLQQLLLGN